jgi:tRNA-dihydrouridine synthase B
MLVTAIEADSIDADAAKMITAPGAPGAEFPAQVAGDVDPMQPPFPDETREITIGKIQIPTRYFLAPLAGYTHLAFRQVIRERGGLGLATTDLVQAVHIVHKHRKSFELIATNDVDRPLSVQIYGSKLDEMSKAAKVLQDQGYSAIDINMGCPMAKIVGTGGGARLACDANIAKRLVGAILESVSIPVTVKMRLGWDRENLTAPYLAREFERLGVAAITIHGRTRAQGFSGRADLSGIKSVVDAVEKIPVVGNGDVRTVADAFHMRRVTGCDAVAIGRGAMLDPWLYFRIQRAHQGLTGPWDPPAEEQIEFLRRHFYLMLDQHGEERSCVEFRKFGIWYGARLGIPEDLEKRMQNFWSVEEFEANIAELRVRHGTRISPIPTADIKVPNGPISHW